MKRVLAVEDNPSKWAQVEAVIRQGLGDVDIVRVSDQREAERLVQVAGWDLLILDISLDIRTGAARAGRGAHDYTGGLKIAGIMYYHECEMPTIIVTGFDAFPTMTSASGHEVILGVQDVDRQARKLLEHHLLGVVRYAQPDWETELLNLLRSVAEH